MDKAEEIKLRYKLGELSHELVIAKLALVEQTIRNWRVGNK